MPITSPTSSTFIDHWAGNVTAKTGSSGGVVVAPLGQVATRTFLASSSATANYVNAMSGHYATENLSGWQTKWPAWYVLQNAGLEIASVAPFTITASVEYPVGGARTQLTWSGLASVQPTLGSDTGLCDPIAVSIPAGALFILHYFASVNSGTGGGLPVTACISGQNMGFSTNDAFEASVTTLTDKTMSGTPAAGSTFYVYPLCIVQQTTNPSFFINGDSRTFGATSGGTIVDANGCMGQITRSLGKTSAWINAAISGTTLAQFNLTGGRRAALAQYCSHVINAMGVNDIRAASGGSARSAAQFVGDAIAGTKMFPAGKTFIACTISNADTATTDAWATTVNQTPDTNAAQILAANASIAALPVPYTYCVDIAGQTNDTTITTAWKAPGYTADGLHGVKAAYDAIVASGIISGTTLGALKGSGFYSIYTANPGILWLDFGNPGSKYSATTFSAISAAGGSFFTQSGTTAQSSSAWPAGNGYAITFGSSGSNYVLGSQPMKDLTNGIAALTLAAIAQYTTAPTTKGPVLAVGTATAANERAVLYISSTGFPSLTYRRQDTDAATTITSAVSIAVNTPVMLEAQLDAANNVVTLYQNGVSVATGTFVASAAVAFSTTSSAVVSCANFNSTQLGMALREANILPFVQTLSQRQKMEGDMAWRAGVAATVLPPGHPYLSAAPTS